MQNIPLMHPLTNKPVPDPTTGSRFQCQKREMLKSVIKKKVANLLDKGLPLLSSLFSNADLTKFSKKFGEGKESDNKGKPRCPNGYHRSPDGDCERVNNNAGDNGRDSRNENSGDNGRDSPNDNAKSNDNNNNNNKDDEDDVKKQGSKDDDSIIDESKDIESSYSNNSPKTITKHGFGSNDCLGYADCIMGLVTKVVDGDTIDVDDMRIRLALVNTPEMGEPGYSKAKEFVQSVCGVGSKALVDEDDEQQSGSYGRTIGMVYCGESTASLNQILLQNGYAKISTQYCGVSEFSKMHWAVTYGCR